MPHRTILLASALALGLPALALANAHIAVLPAQPGEGTDASISASDGKVKVRASTGGRAVSIDTGSIPAAPSVPDLPDLPTPPDLPDAD